MTLSQSLAARLVVVTALVAPAFAYQAATRAGLTGRLVREGEETHPVRRARVVLTGPVTVDADTDTDGVFRIGDLPDGTYRVSVKKAGFVLVDPSAKVTVPTSRPLETIAMRTGAVITGRLVNMIGKPAAAVDVTLSRATTDPAAPKDDSRIIATTDDEGTFRLHTLQPGVYNVFAAGFYYPGKAARAEAEAVRVTAGQTVTLDFQVPWDPPGDRPPPAKLCDVTRFPSNVKAGTGRIAGQISSTDATRSIQRVAVQLSGLSGRPMACAETGPNGAFAFSGVAAGRYYVSATYHPSGIAPFVSLSYGQRTPQDPPTPIALAPGRQFNTVDITLPAFVTVIGSVFDEFGDPAPDVTVGLLQAVELDGKARGMPFARDATTNDMGVFRVPTVSPGTFSVIALSGPFGAGGVFAGPGAPQRDAAGFAVTYHPGTPIARDAQLVQVIDGPPPEISFALVPADLGTVKGRVVDRFGQPVGQVNLTLYQLQDGDIRVIVPARATANKDGTFLIRNVPMGTYLLEARDPKRYGNLTVVVTEREMGNLQLTLRDPISIRGRLIFDGGRDLPDGVFVSIEAYQAEWVAGPVGPRTQNSISHDWTFAITGVMGPTRLRLVTPEPWVVQNITARGRDVTDAPIDASSGDVTDVEIRLARASKTVTGRVVDLDARGVPAAFVLIFASNPSLWSFPSRYVTSVVTDDNGTFEAPPLPATTYVAVPFARSPRIDWMNPEYLATLSGRGESLTVVKGAPAYVQLRLNTRR